MLFLALFNQYIQNFGASCPNQLPEDKEELKRSVCVREDRSVIRRADGLIISQNSACVEYKDVGTGVYADPRFVRVNRQLSLATGMQVFGTIFSPNGPGGAAANQAESARFDMKALFRLNACTNPGLKTFGENLLRFASGSSALAANEGSTMEGDGDANSWRGSAALRCRLFFPPLAPIPALAFTRF